MFKRKEKGHCVDLSHYGKIIVLTNNMMLPNQSNTQRGFDFVDVKNQICFKMKWRQIKIDGGHVGKISIV